MESNAPEKKPLELVVDDLVRTITECGATLYESGTFCLPTSLVAGLEPQQEFLLHVYCQALWVHIIEQPLPDGRVPLALGLSLTSTFYNVYPIVTRKLLEGTLSQLTPRQFAELMLQLIAFCLAMEEEADHYNFVWQRQTDKPEEQYYLDLQAHELSVFSNMFLFNWRNHENCGI